MPKISLIVKGMHCKSCKMLVEDALLDIGAKDIDVSVDEKKQIGKISCDFPDKNKVVDAIEKEGYTVI